METILQGYFKIVQFLINKNTNISVEDINRYRIIDFAADSKQNEEEYISRVNNIIIVRLDANKK